MKARCYSQKSYGYKWYGAKGIKICDEWLNDFESFCLWSINNDYKIGLSIDRIDSKRGYFPENCRFITRSENSRNAFKDNSTFNIKAGEKNLKAKLKVEDVINIRQELKQGIKSITLAKKYNVSDTCIYKIKHNKYWKDIPLMVRGSINLAADISGLQ